MILLYVLAIGLFGLILLFALSKRFRHQDAVHLNTWLTPAEVKSGFQIIYIPPARSKRGRITREAGFEVRLKCQGQGCLRISKENAWDRIAKTLGLTQEIELGDARVDSRVFLGAPDEAGFRKFLSQQEVKNCVIRILQTHPNYLDWDGENLVLRFVPAAHGVLAAPPYFEALKKDLYEFQNSLRRERLWMSEGDLFTHRSLRNLKAHTVAWTLGLISLFVGVSLSLHSDTIDAPSLLTKALGSAFLLVILAWTGLRFYLKKHPLDGKLVFSVLGVLSFYILSFWISGTFVYNAHFDTSPVVAQTYPVTNKYIETRRSGKNRSRRTYHIIEIASDGSVPHRHQVSPNLYNSAQVGKSKLKIESQAGALGYPHIVSRNLEQDY